MSINNRKARSIGELLTEKTNSPIELPNIDIENRKYKRVTRKVDVSQDFGLAISDRSRPALVQRQIDQYEVPFSGDSEVFLCGESSLSDPIHEKIEGGYLIFTYTAGGNSDNSFQKLKEDIAKIDSRIDALAEQINDHNKKIAEQAAKSET